MENNATCLSALHDFNNDFPAEIDVMEANPRKPKQGSFNGAHIDSGAELSVIGLPQAKLYCEKIGLAFRPKENNRWYRVGSKRYPSLGILKIQIPITNDYSIIIDGEVVGCDVPLSLGLDQITALSAVLYFEEEIIASKSRDGVFL